ncbi:mariner Mos1 transposase [Trichonephila clavipes]|nr:mariner Mos1 transposase [Trichonephila clavipes]
MARMWFQHDGSPTHFSADVRNVLDTAYPSRWIGLGGPVNWPARSPDLSCLYFFLCGYMKSLVYVSPVDSDEALVARIAFVAGDIREMPGVFANVRQSLHRWCDFEVEDQHGGGRDKVFEDAELEALLDQDSCQTQQELSGSLGVTQQAISKRLKVMGMIQKQGNWVPYELKPRDVERRLFACE